MMIISIIIAMMSMPSNEPKFLGTSTHEKARRREASKHPHANYVVQKASWQRCPESLSPNP